MNKFKIIKRGITYIPLQVTSSTGAVIELYVNEVDFYSGEPTEVFAFEELRDTPGGLKAIFINEI